MDPVSMSRDLSIVWARTRAGQHTLVIGALPADLPSSCGFYAVRVSCAGPQRPLGPLLDLRREIELLLGASKPMVEHLVDQAAERVLGGLRRRLLGEVHELNPGAAVVEVANRLRQEGEGKWALVFDAVERADDDTLNLLREMVTRTGWLKLPMILVFSTAELDGPAGELEHAMAVLVGPEGQIASTATPESSSSGLGPNSAESRAPLPNVLRGLPSDVVRVLRAGALVGSGFETTLVGSLLGMEPIEVLERLQVASDSGIAVVDQGDGRFDLPDELSQGLRASMLPSLAIAWHRRLAELLSHDIFSLPKTQTEPPASSTSTIATSSTPAEAAPSPESPVAAPPPPAPVSGHSAVPVEVETPNSVPYSIITSDGSQRLRIPTELRSATTYRPEPPPDSAASHKSETFGIATPSEARAAGHLAAAGEHEDAAARYLAAAREAAAVGGFMLAASRAREALELIDTLPATPRRRRLRIAALCEMGRLHWQAASPRETFTLKGALESVMAARALLESDDPPELRAQVVGLLASILYDIGDLPSLERALEELTDASRLLLASGDPVSSARLLNDQAAIYVRLGDVVRASHLLEESRRIFERIASQSSEATALLELAETHHLLARLPLHVAARPGREADAMELGRSHARDAEALYKRLGATRELPRIWETVGRIELRAGRLDRAVTNLTAALEAQRQIGDILGLARTTAALAEALAAAGQLGDALLLLGESIALNQAKGSPIGLSYNRRTLESLLHRLSKMPAPSAASMAAQKTAQHIEEQLLSAEELLGRVTLPSDLA